MSVPEIGQLTKEGVYIGRFKDKDGLIKDYFAGPRDACDDKGGRLLMDFNEAAAYAKDATVLGHNDWFLPPGRDDKSGEPDILGAMFNNKAKIGGFDEAPYRSSSVYGFRDGSARIQHFGNGSKIGGFKAGGLHVRLVRAVIVKSGFVKEQCLKA